MAYNVIVRDKYFEGEKSADLIDIEINYGIKLMAIIIIDIILSYKNYDFILLRIY